MPAFSQTRAGHDSLSALILRSRAKRGVSKDEGGPILRDALLRNAPQDEAGRELREYRETALILRSRAKRGVSKHDRRTEQGCVGPALCASAHPTY
jgi:hypothetical protein